MAAALLATVAAVLVVLGSLAGAGAARATPARVFVLGLPILVAAGASILPTGVVWWSALLIAVVATVGIVLAAPIGQWLAAVSTDRPALAATVAVGRSAVAVVLAAIAVRWLAPIVQSLTNLDASAVAVVAMAAAVAAAVFAGGRLGLARTALVMGIVVAVVILVVGVALGTPDRIADPVVPVAGPSAAGLVLGLVAALLAAVVHPGIADLAKQRRTVLTRGAIATGLIGFATLLGLALLGGGSLQFPSNALLTISGYIAFAPSLVGAVVAAGLVVFLVILLAAALEAALLPWSEQIVPTGWLRHRPVAILAAGTGAFLIAISSFSGGWLTGTVGFVALGVLLAARLAGSKQSSPAEPVTVS